MSKELLEYLAYLLLGTAFILFCKALANTILETIELAKERLAPIEDFKIEDGNNRLTVELDSAGIYMEIDYIVHMERPSMHFIATKEQTIELIEHLQKIVDKG